jgi:hypothetical protein
MQHALQPQGETRQPLQCLMYFFQRCLSCPANAQLLPLLIPIPHGYLDPGYIIRTMSAAELESTRRYILNFGANTTML